MLNVWEALLYLLSPLGAAGSDAAGRGEAAEAVAAPLTELVLSRLERGAAVASDRCAFVNTAVPHAVR